MGCPQRPTTQLAVQGRPQTQRTSWTHSSWKEEPWNGQGTRTQQGHRIFPPCQLEETQPHPPPSFPISNQLTAPQLSTTAAGATKDDTKRNSSCCDVEIFVIINPSIMTAFIMLSSFWK